MLKWQQNIKMLAIILSEVVYFPVKLGRVRSWFKYLELQYTVWNINPLNAGTQRPEEPVGNLSEQQIYQLGLKYIC